jgi:DNA polymerase III alpha subunit
MASAQFIHLRLHSEYSISDGIVRLDDAVAHAVKDGMPGLALTDIGNVFGLVKFYQAARAKGLKPIVGCDLWMNPHMSLTPFADFSTTRAWESNDLRDDLWRLGLGVTFH